MGLLDILNSIGADLQIVRQGTSDIEPGRPVNFSLFPPNLPNLTVPVITTGALNVLWLTKSVRFQDQLAFLNNDASTSLFEALQGALSDATKVIGGQPIPQVQIPLEGPPLKGAIPETTNVAIGISTIAGSVVPPVQHANPDAVPNATTVLQPLPTLQPNPSSATDLLSGVPGLLGQIAGEIPLPTQVPVSLRIQWHVQRRFRDRKKGFVYVDLEEGVDFVAPNGMNLPQVELIFAADPVELTADTTLGTSTFFITAEVTLSADGIATPPIDVPRLPILVPQLGIPRIAAFFRHTNFQATDGGDSGFVFVMVPGNSLFHALNELSPILRDLQTRLGTLTAIARMAAFLLGIEELLNALDAQPLVQFRASDSVRDLEDIVFQEGHWYNVGLFGPTTDVDADEEISSMIFIGIPGKQIQLFNEDGFDDGDGQLTIQTGTEMWASLNSFSFTDQAGANSFKHPVGATVTVSRTIDDNYNDEVESIRFV
jgi:hypothetical protein